MEPRRIVQAASFALSVTSAITLIYLTIDKRLRGLFVTPIVFFAHVGVFYVVVFLDDIGYVITSRFANWSSALMLHGIITVILLVYFLYAQMLVNSWKR
jgi:hypothetical protein